MTWLYKNKEINTIEDFPPNTFGFVYIIIHKPSEKCYIGRKNLFLNQKKKLTKKELSEITGPGRRPKSKAIQKESDWKTYYGSNKTLIELVKNEPFENFERNILVLAPTKKLLTYYETKYLFNYEVLEKPDMYFNDNILAKFFTQDLNAR